MLPSDLPPGEEISFSFSNGGTRRNRQKGVAYVHNGVFVNPREG